MKILIDIGHPAHVHYYRNLALELQKRNHQVVWTVKDIEIAKRLLTVYGFNYIAFPKKADGLAGKVIKQLQFDLKLWGICAWQKIDIAIGTSVTIAHVSKFSKIKSVVFDDDDDDVQPLVTKYVNPFADYLVSPEALAGKRKRNDTVYYPGYHELAYLHPKWFKPDPGVLDELGIDRGVDFFIMRFNVFKAHHDTNIHGLSLEQKLHLIEILKPHGKVFITTERNIETELQAYQLKVSPEKIHSLMAFSSIFLGDSQTMTSEAAVLGIPSLRCNSFAGRISYLEEEEHKYGLTYAFKPENFDKMVEKLKELLSIPNLRVEWQLRRKILLKEKIDVTAFWTWLLENLQESSSVNNKDQRFWDKFRY